jgi:uncharacterized membrane protein YdjX (TVP38/TMEM64 family)
VVLAAVVLLGRYAGPSLQNIPQWVAGLGAWGPIVFIAGYALAVVAFAPASVLTIAAGAIFGLAAGVAYVFVAAVIGSSLAFLISRYVARSAIEHRVAGNQNFKAIDRAVGEQGRWIVFLLRLSPVLPFNLLNYALGLTSVRFTDYLVASFGMLPGTLLYVYAGKAIATLTGADWRSWLLVGVGLVPVVLVTVMVTRIARRALSEATSGTA